MAGGKRFHPWHDATVDPDPDWKQRAVKAGAAVLRQREALGYKTRGQFADDADLTIKTLGQIERGVRPSYNKSTYATIDRVLKWEPGTFEALLTGEKDHLLPPEPVDLESEFATFAGLTANLHRLDDGVLAALLHRANLPFDDVYELVMQERAVAVEQLRDSWQRLAEQIRARGGTVDVGTWPPWLEAPPIVEEIRHGGSE